MENEIKLRESLERMFDGAIDVESMVDAYIEGLKSDDAKQYWQEQLKQPVKTLEEVGLYWDDFNRSYCSKIGGLIYSLRPHQMTPDQLRAIANHIEQTNKTPTK